MLYLQGASPCRHLRGAGGYNTGRAVEGKWVGSVGSEKKPIILNQRNKSKRRFERIPSVFPKTDVDKDRSSAGL